MAFSLDSAQQPLISLIIPTTGTSRVLPECLRAWLRTLASVSHELIVVLDQKSSADLILPLKKEFPSIQFLHASLPGVAAARNAGLRMAQGQAFLLLDDDCLPLKNFSATEVLQRAHSKLAVHGGLYQLELLPKYWAQVYHWINVSWLDRGLRTDGTYSHLLGGYIFGTNEIAQKISFDPNLLWGGEEKDMIGRLKTQFALPAVLHWDLKVEHRDSSGFFKMVRRAFCQGLASGLRDQHQEARKSFRPTPSGLAPGLAAFYFFSRLGIILGKFSKMKNGNPTRAQTSPAA